MRFLIGLIIGLLMGSCASASEVDLTTLAKSAESVASLTYSKGCPMYLATNYVIKGQRGYWQVRKLQHTGMDSCTYVFLKSISYDNIESKTQIRVSIERGFVNQFRGDK